MNDFDCLAARLLASAPLAGMLSAGLEAFEVIRATCRACQDRQSTLLPAFMQAVAAAVDGRNALAAAPSLPPGGCRPSSQRLQRSCRL